MRVLKNILNFYVQSSIHVALAVISLAGVVSLEANLPLSNISLALLLTATISGYNFVKFAGIAKLHHQSLTKNLKLIQIFSFLSGAALIYLLFKQSVEQLWLLVSLAIVNFLYAIPFLPKDKSLRSLRGTKIFIIALIWTFSVVVYPGIDSLAGTISWDLVIRFIQIFCFLIAITLPFEIRDITGDRAELGTIPQKIGIKKTKLLGYILGFAFIGLSVLLKPELIPNIPELIIFGTVLFVIFKSTPDRSFYFTAFWVEAIPIAWFLLEKLNLLIL